MRRLSNNTIILRWETAAGEVIDTKKYEDQTTLSITLLADGHTRLWVIIEAPGSKTWENAIRLKLNGDKPLQVMAEMVRESGLQG